MESIYQRVANLINKNTSRNIIILTGAGISTAAGIPDFRTPGTGLHDIIKTRFGENVAPEDIFTLKWYKKKPEEFMEIMYPIINSVHAPTEVHHFIKFLSQKGKLLRNYTQNIDGLERVVGIPAEQLVECHGSFKFWTCTICSRKYTSANDFLTKQKKPICKCHGLIRPDIVFYKEDLPRRFYECSRSDFAKCELLIVFGTSLRVTPFARLVLKKGPSTRLWVNLQEPPLVYGRLKWVKLLGNCDDHALRLIAELDWAKEFSAMKNTFMIGEDEYLEVRGCKKRRLTCRAFGVSLPDAKRFTPHLNTKAKIPNRCTCAELVVKSLLEAEVRNLKSELMEKKIYPSQLTLPQFHSLICGMLRDYLKKKEGRS